MTEEGTRHEDEERDATSSEHVWPEAPTVEAPPAGSTEPGPETVPGGARRLLRSRDDRVIAGVAGGLGRYFDVDPVIIRIALAITVLFGGLGVVAYLAAALFVPSDDGAGRAAPSSRARTFARILGVGLLVLGGLGAFGALTATAAFVTAIGYGLPVVAAIVLIGIALVALSFRGGARWLIVPALALSIGAAVAAAADFDLDGGIGRRDYRPASASAIPDGGYELGVGRLALDLRGIDWAPSRVVDLDVDLGVGEAVVAVPSGVCVVATAHVRAGELQIAGQDAGGIDVDANVEQGSTATPRLELDAQADLGQIRVVADDAARLDPGRPPLGRSDGEDRAAVDANSRACAG